MLTATLPETLGLAVENARCVVLTSLRKRMSDRRV